MSIQITDEGANIRLNDNSGDVYVIGFVIHYFVWQFGESQ